MALILAIDLGTTNLKAGVVNDRGDILAVRKKQVPVIQKESGASEHDPEDLFDSVIELCSQVTPKFKGQIQQVVISAYQFGLVCLDKAKMPLGNISLLSDIRAQRTFESFKHEFDTAELYRRTGCPPLFQYSLARLYYLKKERPEVFNATSFFASSKDYILYRLTGELVTEPSIAAATQMMNATTLTWDTPTLQKIGIREEQLPPILRGDRDPLPILASAAKAMGLEQKVTVLPGFFDGGACAVGLSGLEEGIGVINAGTSAMLRVPHSAPAFDNTPDMRLQPYALTPGHYLNGGGLNNAALPLDWVRSKLFDVDLSDPDILESKHSGSPLFAIPYLTGERDCRVGPFASGVFFGLRNYHTRHDIARSLLEGVSYTLRIMRDTLQENGVEMREIRMGGGGTAWAVWPQIIADILNTKIFVPRAQEIGLIGSAMLGYTNLERYKNLEDAATHMLNAGESVEPDEARAAMHNQRYEFFRELVGTLAPVFKKHSTIA